MGAARDLQQLHSHKLVSKAQTHNYLSINFPSVSHYFSLCTCLSVKIFHSLSFSSSLTPPPPFIKFLPSVRPPFKKETKYSAGDTQEPFSGHLPDVSRVGSSWEHSRTKSIQLFTAESSQIQTRGQCRNLDISLCKKPPLLCTRNYKHTTRRRQNSSFGRTKSKE